MEGVRSGFGVGTATGGTTAGATDGEPREGADVPAPQPAEPDDPPFDRSARSIDDPDSELGRQSRWWRDHLAGLPEDRVTLDVGDICVAEGEVDVVSFTAIASSRRPTAGPGSRGRPS